MQKIVIKLGSSSLTNGTKRLSRSHMVEIVRQISSLHQAGHQVIVVSSGAIAAGREYCADQSNYTSLPSKQMLASIGQVRLMNTWSDLFNIYDLSVGQVLLTRSDVSDEKRAENAQNTLLTLLSHRVIPIVNENDTVATEEIRFGDNDNLSALVANLIQADLLILLTDQEGLFTADPRTCPDAKLIETIEVIDENVACCAKGTHPDGVGTGGMTTKLQAAQKATTQGTSTIIASSKEPNILISLIDGKKIGTFFPSKKI